MSESHIQREERFISNVLSNLYENGEAVKAGVAVSLEPEDFEDRQLGRIWQAAIDTARDESVSLVDGVSIGERLSREGDLEAVGGVATILSLSDAYATAAYAVSDARKIRRRGLMRRGIRDGAELIRDAGTGDADPDRLRDWASRYVRKLSSANAVMPMSAYQAAVELMDGGNETRIVRSGFRDLDKRIGGFVRGSLVIVAGRPSVGKTVFMVDSARQAASRAEDASVFALEMSCKELVARALSSISGVPAGKLLRGETLEPHERSSIPDAMEQLSTMRLMLHDVPSVNCASIGVSLDMADRKADLIVVDYLQIMPVGSNRHAGFADITSELKRMARSLNAVILLGSQITRSSVRENREPGLHDLRDSGGIEADADLVLFIHHPDETKHERVLIVGKNRHGPRGRIDLPFWPERVSFLPC